MKTIEFTIRQEQKSDYQTVYKLVELTFKDMAESDHSEHLLVERLRKSDTFIPELSLVAERDGEIIGQIMLTKVEIVSDLQTVISLGVAPLSVLPEYQGQGIGGTLICEAHKRAATLGYGSALLLGHKDYYPRFGYKKAISFGIRFPFDVPHDYCMAIELLPEGLKNVHGMVKYPEAFIE